MANHKLKDREYMRKTLNQPQASFSIVPGVRDTPYVKVRSLSECGTVSYKTDVDSNQEYGASICLDGVVDYQAEDEQVRLSIKSEFNRIPEMEDQCYSACTLSEADSEEENGPPETAPIEELSSVKEDPLADKTGEAAQSIRRVAGLKNIRYRYNRKLGEESLKDIVKQKKTLINADKGERLQKTRSELDLRTIVQMVCAKHVFAYRSNKIHYYNGRFYQPLTKKRFIKIAIDVLPEKMIQGVKSLYLFNGAFDFYTCMQMDEPETTTTGDWVTFENCDFNVRTGIPAPHSPAHKTFFEIHANYTPENMECLNMDNLLDSMTAGDKVSIQLVWDMLGYLILDIPVQRAFFYIGMAPASGKSVLGGFIGRLFGKEECHHTEADKLGEKFGMSNFVNQRIDLSMESRGNLSKATITTIKELTGNDIISIERKNHDPVDIVNHTRLIMASNDPLYIDDDAFWDRCKIIPAVRSCPPEQIDPDLDDKIWEERDAIATRAVMAAKDLIKRKFRFIESEYALVLKNEWRNEVQDPMSSFLEEQVEFVQDADFISTQQLYEAYCEGGYKPISERGFSMKLSAAIGRRAAKIREGGLHGYCGVSLRSPDV